MSKGHAVAVLLIAPDGVPLIRDPKKPPPVYWKLPGGRGNAEETATEVALREMVEETGISLKGENLEIIHQQDKGNHTLTIFAVDVHQPLELMGLKKRGDEGEEVRVFSPQAILSMRDFFPNHRTRLVELRILEAI